LVLGFSSRFADLRQRARWLATSVGLAYPAHWDFDRGRALGGARDRPYISERPPTVRHFHLPVRTARPMSDCSTLAVQPEPRTRRHQGGARKPCALAGAGLLRGRHAAGAAARWCRPQPRILVSRGASVGVGGRFRCVTFCRERSYLG
jgi:hypothetical protein